MRHHLKGAGEVQLDYDCPDRLLGEYAERLSVLQSELPEIRLSVTALAGWIQRSGFKDVAARVDAIYPMFYDLEADLPAAARESRLHPIAGSAMQLDFTGAWAACKTPWHAGLPNFSRLSIFDPEGNLKGHLRDWRWDEVVFHPLLESVEDESRPILERLIRGDTFLSRLRPMLPALVELSEVLCGLERGGFFEPGFVGDGGNF